ncbi:MAG: GNAT family N-acetyltransferase [Oceanococcus sp.]
MPLQIDSVTWDQASDRCLSIREHVFVLEQGINRDIEIDGLDPQCQHLLCHSNGEDIATARMLPDGHIGRVAVMPAWRKQGIGQSLIERLCSLAREQGMPSVYLGSQHSAIGFYQAIGFAPEGAIFIEAGIPHQYMRFTL